ncbi:MAG: nucleoside transporter C-terminal domain-containing protein [Steroidobacteraceae bacterium]
MTAGGFLQAVAGMAAFVGLGVLLSASRRRIDWRLVATAIVLQFVICALLLRVPVAAAGLAAVGRGVDAVTDATRAGTTFLFGFLGGGAAPFAVAEPGALVTFAFRLLPIVIVMSALSALLWHWQVLPLVVRALAGLFERTLGTRGPAGLAATAEIFAGPVESPLLVRPYLAAMTRYELLLLMTAGLATIAGSVMALYAAMLGPFFGEALGHLLTKSVMSVPASILFAHLLLPEDPRDQPVVAPPRLYTGSMDALTRGTQDGLGVYLGVMAMLLVLVSLVALLNGIVGLLPAAGGEPLSLERMAGWIFAPVAWCMGVPWSEAPAVGSLLGVKTVLNEFVAYAQFTQLPPDTLDARSRLITIYALCGFANFGSIGIQLGGIGAMAPERRADLAALAMPALVAATLASCMTAAIAGLVAA